MRALLARPLLLSQVLTSASGALATFLAAALMTGGEFLRFSLVNLVAITLVGLVRSFLLQPALIEMRRDKGALTPGRYAGSAAVLAGGVLAGAAAVFGVRDPASLAVLALSGPFPILQDWLRFRAMAEDRRWDVALSDGLRLLLVGTSPVLLAWRPEAVAYQAFLGFSLALPVAVALLRLPRVTAHTPLRSYLRPASLQLADFSVGQFTSVVPLLVLGGVGTSALIAGLRFAQTLLGPLNLVFAASTTHLIADSATRDTHATTAQLVREGNRLARMVAALSAVVVAVTVGAVALTGFELRGVEHRPMLVGLALVGVATLSSGWSGIHAIVLRLLGRQGTATAGRVVLVAVTLCCFGLGYAVDGQDGSLVAGFLATAVVSPLAFALPAHVVYRRLRDEPVED